MPKKRDGLLRADQDGFFHLYTADISGCWHFEGPCDKSCAQAGEPVKGFKATNAYGPAEVRADKLGYTILDV